MSRERSGGEPTEKPTPKRLREARQKGQVAKSADLTGLAVFAAAAGTVLLTGVGLAGTLSSFVRDCLRTAPMMPETGAHAVLERGVRVVALTAGPVLAAGLVVAVIVGGLQVGALWTWKPLQPEWKRLNPMKGLKQLVSLRKLVDMVRILVALTALGVVVWVTLYEAVGSLVRLSGAEPVTLAAVLYHWSITLAWRGGLVLLVAAAADYGLQRYRHQKDQKMTKEEVRREHKEMEGDPQHKAERRRLHREISEHDMIEQVSKADFVVANPDHLAVALRYDAARHDAPQVVAKGQRLVAQRIKQVARQSGVPIVHDVSLARALSELEMGDAIPETLYEAVAVLLRAIGDEASDADR